MTPPPDVSCILIFLNGLPFLEEAMRSVVAQDGSATWELILVDDGSDDGSTSIAQRWATADPARVRYFEHPGHENRGMSASRNLGVEMARGEFVGFLDCDDVWLPSALAHRTRVLADHPDADVLFGGTWRWFSWTGEPADSALDNVMPQPPNVALRTTVEPPALFSAIYSAPGAWAVPGICSVLIRRTALQAIGGLVDDFRGMYEDQVLYAKVMLSLPVVLDDRPLALYRQHPDSACSVSIRTGDWSREERSPAEDRFLHWLREFVHRERGKESLEWLIVQRNMDREGNRRAALRRMIRRTIPKPIRDTVRVARHRRRDSQTRSHFPLPGDDEGQTPSILRTWTTQFLSTWSARPGEQALVVSCVTAGNGGWYDSIPNDLRSGLGHYQTRSLDQFLSMDDVRPDTRFDWIFVPLEASTAGGIKTMLVRAKRLLAPTGTLLVLVPGPAFSRQRFDTGEHMSRANLQGLASELFPAVRVSVETFGNAVTVAAIEQGLPPSGVAAVELDRHDPSIDAVLALAVWPARPMSGHDAPQSASGVG